MTNAKKLAKTLFTDDMGRADEVPLQRDGRKAYDGWLAASSDAGDQDTLTDLRSVDRGEFAEAWERLVEAAG